MNRIVIILTFLCLSSWFTSTAQTNILNRTVTVSVTNVRLDHALNQIAGAGHFMFSYNTEIIKADSLVTISATNETVRTILDKIFNKKIRYIENGNYLILKKNPSQPVAGKPKKSTYIITGYVVNTLTGEKIEDASVYDKISLASALSGPEGFYTLKISSIHIPGSISASKADFLDTVIMVKPVDVQELTIPLTPVVQTVTVEPVPIDTVKKEPVQRESVTVTDKRIEQSEFLKWLLSQKLKLMARNIDFTGYSKFQFSVVPGVSTNGLMGSHIVNDYSVNLFGGFTGGTNRFEAGSLFNIDRGSAKYTQVAGVFNIVGGEVTGFQAAGIVNHVVKSVTGAQVSGAINTVIDSVKGVQAAGLLNFAGNHLTGVQAAGAINLVTNSVEGAQVSGLINFASKEVNGTQVSGAINYAKKIDGAQVTGLVNVAPVSVTGAQISGGLNFARHIRGTQIGLVNIADSSEGCPIGLLSFVVHGFHKLEVSSNEVTYLNLAFKTGNKSFYNILKAGINPDFNNRIYSAGYGLGHEFTLSKKSALDLELSYQYIGEYWDTYNGLHSINLNYAYQPSPKFGIVIGPSLNVLYMDDPRADLFTSYKIPTLDMPSLNFINRNDFKEWVGVHVGVRFF